MENLLKSGAKVLEISGKVFRISVEAVAEIFLTVYEFGESFTKYETDELCTASEIMEELGIEEADLGEPEEICSTRCERPLVYIGANEVVCQCSTWHEVQE